MSACPIALDGGVLSGLFRWEDQDGFPLSMALGLVVEHDLLVSWGDYFAQAKKAGWPWERVERKVREALADCPEYPLTFEDCVRSVFQPFFYGSAAWTRR